MNSKGKLFWKLKVLKNYWWFLKSWVKDIFKKKSIEKRALIPSFENQEKYLTVIIENKSDNKEIVNLFSMNNISLPDHLSVVIQEARFGLHDELIKIKTGRKVVNGFRYIVSSTDQLSNELTLYSYNGFGYISSMAIRPLAFRTSYQNQSHQIDAPGYKFHFNANTIIDIPVNPKEKITLILQITDEPSDHNELQSGLIKIIR